MKEYSYDERVDRVFAKLEIENCMGRHVYCHGEGWHREEILYYWAKPDAELTWTNNSMLVKGYEEQWQSYVVRHEEMFLNKRLDVCDAFPHANNLPFRTLGSVMMHTLTTPVIEIGEDGMSAKGIFYTPGVILDVLPTKSGAACSCWMWERYAVDFIKEDGEWRILHLSVFTDTATDVDNEEWVNPLPEGPFAGVEGDFKPPEERYYKRYKATQPVQAIPRIPEKYTTLSETFSY